MDAWIVLRLLVLAWMYDLLCVFEQARKASVQQDNELAEIRERVQARADFMWDLKMHTKKMTEDVDDRREELRIKIRTLSTTSNTLSTARNKLKVQLLST
jgi:predicted  nucleic acid-binding Zn-ribbon protein